MILSQDEILELCEHPFNADLIKACQVSHVEHKRHITGEGYKALVNTYEYYETKEERKIKKQLSKPATLPITTIIRGELNRWTNAQGTYKSYDFGDKRDLSEGFINDVLSQLWRGGSLDSFIKGEYKDLLDTDFCSFLTVVKPRIIEESGVVYYEREGIKRKAKPNELPRPYIIYTDIADVLDFRVYGNRVEYIIFKYGEERVKNGEKRIFYRVIDDEKDLIVVKDPERVRNGMLFTIADDEDILPNDLGYVPSIQVSTLNSNLGTNGLRESQLTFLIPSLDRYMSMDSEHVRSEVIHAHPQRWGIAQVCPECEGDGSIDNDSESQYYNSEIGEGHSMSCPICGGSGGVLALGSGDVVKLPQYDDMGNAYPAKAPGGYIQMDTKVLDHQTTELEKLWNDIIYAGTSNKNIVSDRFKTATETNTNTKTLEDKIDDRLNVIESVESFLVGVAASMDEQYGTNYRGCTVKYGRNLYYRSEKDILEVMELAKRAGSPMAYIKTLVIELYQTKYRNSKEERERALRLVELEPYPGYTTDELLGEGVYVDDELLCYKMNFNDIVEEYENQGKDIVDGDILAVRKALREINKNYYEKISKNIISTGGTQDIR